MPLTKANDGRPGLVLVHESEAACRKRLEAAGFAEPHVSEITSYLAQSTDMEPEFERLERACAGRGLASGPSRSMTRRQPWRAAIPRGRWSGP